MKCRCHILYGLGSLVISAKDSRRTGEAENPVLPDLVYFHKSSGFELHFVDFERPLWNPQKHKIWCIWKEIQEIEI